ncbi:MAG: hypothetical protein AB2693_26540, partial [Candidatus Thiodiazotropha sp.]
IGEEDMEEKKQFVISMVVSCHEIQNEDFSEMQRFSGFVERVNRADQRYISYGRITVLLNTPWNYAHGEARLLDPNGEILKSIIEDPPFPYNRSERINFLSLMFRSFYHAFGADSKPILLLFSYYIPCTIRGYMCSNLISEFAASFTHKMIIGYESLNIWTNEKNAYAVMNKPNIHVVRIPVVNLENDVNINTNTQQQRNWRQNCNVNWSNKGHESDRFSDKVVTYKVTRRVMRRKIRAKINKIMNKSKTSKQKKIRRFCTGTRYEDQIYNASEYLKAFKRIDQCKEKQGHKNVQRTWFEQKSSNHKKRCKHYHEIFWLGDESYICIL